MLERWKFEDYSIEEARSVAAAFVEAASLVDGDRDGLSTHAWTAWILDWFSASAGRDVVVDAKPRQLALDGHALPLGTGRGPLARETVGEFLVDLTHGTFLPYVRPNALAHGWGTVGYWQDTFADGAPPRRLKLALESEMGSERNDRLNICRVMEDAAKLFVISADVKVVIFASRGDGDRATLIGLARRMAEMDETKPKAWMWIDLPWDPWNDARAPMAWVFDAKGGVTEH